MGKYVNKAAQARRRRGRIRTGLVLILLLAFGALLDPAIVSPFGPLASRPERVDAKFAKCGTGRDFACVVDGDTFRLGDRRVRIVGIDAPELAKPHCPAEAALAARATDRLVQLLNQGPLDLVAHRFHGADRFQRDLRVVWHGDRSIGDQLMSEGLAHRYVGFKRNWC